MPVKIEAIPCKGEELRPGDLFSTAGPMYWDRVDLNQSIGERVYIRMNTPSLSADDADTLVYKIHIVKEKEKRKR